VRDAGPGLIAHTLLEERDLNKANSYFDEAAKLPVDPEMVDLAIQLIKRQKAKYDPADLVDRYESRLRAMIDAKVAGMPLKPEERFERTNVIDLVSALRKSIEESEAAERAAKGPPPKKGRPALLLRSVHVGVPNLAGQSAPIHRGAYLPSDGQHDLSPLCRMDLWWKLCQDGKFRNKDGQPISSPWRST
jgi:hypothetical protein